jgi:hypothetical protein
LGFWLVAAESKYTRGGGGGRAEEDGRDRGEKRGKSARSWSMLARGGHSDDRTGRWMNARSRPRRERMVGVSWWIALALTDRQIDK